MNTVFDTIIRVVSEKFGQYHVQLEVVPESPNTRLVAVYGVSASDMVYVRQMIKDLDWELCLPQGLVALAHVVNAETTTQHFPEFASTPPEASVSFWSLIYDHLPSRCVDQAWIPPNRYRPTTSANTQYALAA